MAASLHPWEQRADEPTPAYEAFKVYRDLGARRTVDAVAAKLGGHQEGTKRAPGHLKKWSSAYDWVDRARAYDIHQASLFQKGIDQETVRQGREMAEIRDKEIRKGIARWQRRLMQSDVIADMPLTTQTVERDGKVIVIEPVGTLDHYRATMIASRGHQRLWELIDRGMALEDKDAEKTASEVMPIQAPDAPAAGGPNELEDWRAYQRTQILRMPTEPPDDAPGSPYYPQG